MLRLTLPCLLAVAFSGCVSAGPRGPQPHGRPCAGITDYPTDTSIDYDANPELRPRQVSPGGPRYPLSQRAASVEGSVRAEFVVDTNGTVPRGTAIITKESDRAFGDAVCSWLTTARFAFPPDRRPRSVRVANFPFEFALTRSP